MTTEELNHRGGLFSGLAAKDELNQLLDELDVDGFEEFIKWVDELEAELEEEEEPERVLEPAAAFYC